MFQSLGSLAQNWWQVAIFVFLCTGATYFVSRRLTPIYEATTTIDVDRQAPPGIIGQDAKRRDVDTDYDQFLATQVKIIESDAVLRPIVAKYNLAEKEGPVRGDVVRGKNAEARANAPITLKNLYVTRPANTFLLQVSYRSTEPQLAADVANGIANSFLEHIFRTRVEASAKLSSFMEKQLEELKNKMEASGIALTRFERDMHLISPEEKTNMLSARMMQVNADYTSAQTDRVRKEASYNSVRTETIEAALISTQDDSLKLLLEKQNEAEGKFVQIKKFYDVRHPEYVKAAAQAQEIARQIEMTRQSLTKRAQAEYLQAVARERMLDGMLTQIRGEFDLLNSRSFEFEQLKREAEADKKLYEELVRRIREANINANFENTSMRLSNMARAGIDPVSPRIRQNMLLAFMLSSMLGCGVVLLNGKLDGKIRSAGQISYELGTNVVGILPAVKVGGMKDMSSLATQGGHTAIDRRSTGAARSATAFEESIRTLRNSILLGGRDRYLRSILVTSAATGEGKSTAALHLAVAHAAHGQRTLLIDADLRRPTLHKLLAVGNQGGLAGVVLTGRPATEAIVCVDKHPGLYFLPAGEPSQRASDLLSQRSFEIIDYLSPMYDLIVVDGPPFLGIAESICLASAVDTVAVVARVGKTNLAALELVLQNLREMRAEVAGVVLNHAVVAIGEAYGNYR